MRNQLLNAIVPLAAFIIATVNAVSFGYALEGSRMPIAAMVSFVVACVILVKSWPL